MSEPASLRCRVLWAPATDLPQARALLDGEERDRYRNLREPADRARFVTGRALVRTVLGRATGTAPERLRISRVCRHCGGPDGKPFVPGAAVGFSLSHSGDRVVLAVAEGAEIGVDVQSVTRRNADASADRIAGRVLADGEFREFGALPADRRAHAFAVFWARKEALLKAVGRGISVSKRDIRVSAPGQPAQLVDWKGEFGGTEFGLADLPAAGAGYAAALAVQGERNIRVAEHVLGDPLDADR